MTNVIAKDFLFDPAQRGIDRRELCHDVDAIAILFDHPRYPTDLALYAIQAFSARRFRFLFHVDHIPHPGIKDKNVYTQWGYNGVRKWLITAIRVLRQLAAHTGRIEVCRPWEQDSRKIRFAE